MKSAKGTLEGENYVYNPFTTNDIWGRPSDVQMGALQQSELPVGADDSAMPLMSQEFVRSGVHPQGSDDSAAWKRRSAVKEAQNMQSYVMLAGFAAIMAWAMFYRAGSL